MSVILQDIKSKLTVISSDLRPFAYQIERSWLFLGLQTKSILGWDNCRTGIIYLSRKINFR